MPRQSYAPPAPTVPAALVPPHSHTKLAVSLATVSLTSQKELSLINQQLELYN